AAIASFVAGTFSVVALQLAAPLVARAALAFGPAEYFAFALLGVVLLANLTGGSRVKSLAMVVVGIMLATVGMDPLGGSVRFTFGGGGPRAGFKFSGGARGPLGRGGGVAEEAGAGVDAGRGEGEVQRAVSEPRGATSLGTADAARHGARLPGRPDPRPGGDDRVVRFVWRRAEGLEAPARARNRGDRGRRWARGGQQRGGRRRHDSPALVRLAVHAVDGRAAERDAADERDAGAVPAPRSPAGVLGRDRQLLRRQRDVAAPQPAAGGRVRAGRDDSLALPDAGRARALRRRCVLGQQQRLRRVGAGGRRHHRLGDARARLQSGAARPRAGARAAAGALAASGAHDRARRRPGAVVVGAVGRHADRGRAGVPRPARQRGAAARTSVTVSSAVSSPGSARSTTSSTTPRHGARAGATMSARLTAIAVVDGST